MCVQTIGARCCEFGKTPALSNEMVRSEITTAHSALRPRAAPGHSNVPFRGEGGKVWNRRVSPLASGRSDGPLSKFSRRSGNWSSCPEADLCQRGRAMAKLGGELPFPIWWPLRPLRHKADPQLALEGRGRNGGIVLSSSAPISRE